MQRLITHLRCLIVILNIILCINCSGDNASLEDTYRVQTVEPNVNSNGIEGSDDSKNENEIKEEDPYAGEDLIPVHGRYSAVYEQDWSLLGNGKEEAQHDLSNIEFTAVTYQESGSKNEAYYFTDQESAVIKDVALEITWDVSESSNYNTSFIYINNVEDITIENLYIKQMNDEQLGSYTIVINDCGKLHIKNVYISGPIRKSHISVDDCEEVLIENVELAGKAIEHDGNEYYIMGGGISIDFGSKGSQPLREPKWLVMQNIYIHDFNFTEIDGDRNHDAIAIRSPGDGILFNTYIENWRLSGINDQGYDVSGSGMDIGHARWELGSDYTNKLFRVERNVLVNSPSNKTAAYDWESNSLFFANNIYYNSSLLSYSCKTPIYQIHETHYIDADFAANEVWKSTGCTLAGDGIPHAQVYRENSLVVATDSVLEKFVTLSGGLSSSLDGDNILNYDHNTYLFNADPIAWQNSLLEEEDPGIPYLMSWSDWQANGQDVNSTYNKTSDDCFKDAANGDFSLLSTCEAKNNGSNNYKNLIDYDGTKVMQDFNGNERDELTPSAGAFE
jgi:hypothetical protein